MVFSGACSPSPALTIHNERLALQVGEMEKERGWSGEGVVAMTGGWGELLHLAPVLFLCCFLGVGVRGRTMGRKMVPNQRLNGNTVGGSGSFKAWPGHIVLPDRQRRMEFAGGCQKVSILCERLKPLFTGLSRAQAPFVLLLLSPLTGLFLTWVRQICARRFLPKVRN